MKLAILQTGSTGSGVFTLLGIEEGDVVFVFEGDERWAWEIEEERLQRCLQVGIDRYIVPKPHSSGWYINHSCSPNSAVRGKNQIVAIRGIEPREEITMDYSFNIAWESFKMECKCKSSNCRGIIKDYLSLPENVRATGRKYTSEYLLSFKL